MAFKLRSGNRGAFKALKASLWQSPGAEEESNNTVENDVDTENAVDETKEAGDDSEAKTAARSSDIALNQLISPKEKKRGGLKNPRIKKRAEVRGQRYNQAVDSEMGVEGVEGPGDFERGMGEGSAMEAWGLGGGGIGSGMGFSSFFKKKKY